LTDALARVLEELEVMVEDNLMVLNLGNLLMMVMAKRLKTKVGGVVHTSTMFRNCMSVILLVTMMNDRRRRRRSVARGIYLLNAARVVVETMELELQLGQ